MPDHARTRPDPSEPPARGGWLRGWLPALPFAALLLLASWRGSEGFAWRPSDLAWVAAVDLLLVLGLHQGARWARAVHPLFGLVGSALLAAAVCVGLRLDAELLPGTVRLVGAAAFLAAGHQLLLLVLAPRPRRGEDARGVLGVAVLALLLGATLAVVAFRERPSTRLHLLRHQRLVGLPLYALLSRPIEAEELRLRERLGPPLDAGTLRAGLPAPPAGAAGDTVVFVLVDTWRADTLAAWGGAEDLMPRLNALAAEGTVLTDVHANASWTRASCATFFTGLLPEESGATSFNDILPEAWTTLPEALQARGYATAAFVTNWIQVGIETGFAQGFEHFEQLHDDMAELEARLEEGAAHIRELYMRAEGVNAAVFEWLDGPGADRRGTRPLFLYVHYLDPHSPYLAGVEPGTPADPRERKRSGYRQEVRYTDEHLAALVEGLRARLGDDVTFVLTSDHGEEFWEHGAWGHGHSLYREQLWVPVVVLQGGDRDGRVVAAPLELRDLYDLSLALAEPGALDVAAWAAPRARAERYASQYLEQASEAPLPDQRRTVMRRLDAADAALIWSAFGPTEEVFAPPGAPERENLVGRDAERDRRLRAALESAPRFWARAAQVQRSQAELEFLAKLGYGGGVAQPPPGKAVREPQPVTPPDHEGGTPAEDVQ